MILFCFLWFAALYFISYKISKNNDILSPVKFVSIKYALLNLPFIFIIWHKPFIFKKGILKICNVSLEDAFLQYTKVQTVAFISLLLGIYAYNKWRNVKPGWVINTTIYNYKALKIKAIVFFCIALGAYSVFIYRIGGLYYLLTHLDNRIGLQSGQYILQLLSFLYIAVLLFMLCVKLNDKKSDKIIFFIAFLSACFIFSSFGARKNTMLLIVMVIFSYHYMIKKISFSTINKPLVLLIVLMLSGYILMIPILRNKEKLTQLEKEKTSKYISLDVLIYNVSYTYIDIFAANYFNRENAWYLSGITDPVKVFSTKGDKSAVPPVDEGAYFWNIVKNQRDYRPSTPRGELSEGSWPIENFGFGYANFLLPGIIVAFFLQGICFSFFYNLFKSEIYNPVLVYGYVLVMLSFNFSNLRLVQLITTLPLALLCYTILYFIRMRRNT